MKRRALALAALLAAVHPNLASTQEAGVRTTLDGVYTSEQAAQGKEIYQRACAACHVLDYYAGDVLRAWEGRAVFDLYDLIRTRMPENNPGSLRSREYVAMMAYILELNDMPPGEEPLSGRSSVLKNIVFQWRDDHDRDLAQDIRPGGSGHSRRLAPPRAEPGNGERGVALLGRRRGE